MASLWGCEFFEVSSVTGDGLAAITSSLLLQMEASSGSSRNSKCCVM